MTPQSNLFPPCISSYREGEGGGGSTANKQGLTPFPLRWRIAIEMWIIMESFEALGFYVGESYESS